MNPAIAASPAFSERLRSSWNRAADAFSPLVSEALLGITARFALGAIFFL